MSEGELKKRIAVVISGEATKTGIWHNKDVFKVLDEAKKEWELIEENHRKLTEEDPMHDYEGDEEHYDKDAWKKKWLGDSS